MEKKSEFIMEIRTIKEMKYSNTPLSTKKNYIVKVETTIKRGSDIPEQRFLTRLEVLICEGDEFKFTFSDVIRLVFFDKTGRSTLIKEIKNKLRENGKLPQDKPDGYGYSLLFNRQMMEQLLIDIQEMHSGLTYFILDSNILQRIEQVTLGLYNQQPSSPPPATPDKEKETESGFDFKNLNPIEHIEVLDYTNTSSVPNFDPNFFNFMIHLKNPNHPANVFRNSLRMRLIRDDLGCFSHYHLGDYLNFTKIDSTKHQEPQKMLDVLIEKEKLPSDTTLTTFIHGNTTKRLLMNMKDLGLGDYPFMLHIVNKIWFFLDQKLQQIRFEQIKTLLLDVDAMVQRSSEKIQEYKKSVENSIISIDDYPNIKRLRESFSTIFIESEKPEDPSKRARS